MDTHVRTIAKALSWRVVGLLVTMTIAYGITGRGDVAAGIGLADTVIKLLMFYFHERLWLRIKFGQPPPPPVLRSSGATLEYFENAAD